MGDGFDDPAGAVAWLGAVQAQEYAEAKWSLGQRVRGCTDADVEAACDRGEILRTHVLRPTWHFVAAPDIRWLLRLTSPRVKAVNRSYDRRAGLDDGLLTRVFTAIAHELSAGEPRTRRELRAALAAAGIDFDNQQLAHAVMHAELDGLVCSGPRRGKQHTYALLDDRVPPGPERSREEDLAELTVRYFRSHGPATARDFAWWSSLTATEVKDGLAAARERLVEEFHSEGVAWYSAPGLPKRPRPSAALLLGTYDEAAVAYKNLRFVPARSLGRAILLGGRAVGSWKASAGDRAISVEASPSAPLAPAELRALEREVERYGRFFGRPAVLVS